MGSSVGTGRRLNPASTRAGRGRAGGERGAGLGTCQPIGVRREAAGAGGGARPGDDVTWSEWRAAWNASRDPGRIPRRPSRRTRREGGWAGGEAGVKVAFEGGGGRLPETRLGGRVG